MFLFLITGLLETEQAQPLVVNSIDMKIPVYILQTPRWKEPYLIQQQRDVPLVESFQRSQKLSDQSMVRQQLPMMVLDLQCYADHLIIQGRLLRRV